MPIDADLVAVLIDEAKVECSVLVPTEPVQRAGTPQDVAGRRLACPRAGAVPVIDEPLRVANVPCPRGLRAQARDDAQDDGPWPVGNTSARLSCGLCIPAHSLMDLVGSGGVERP